MELIPIGFCPVGVVDCIFRIEPDGLFDVSHRPVQIALLLLRYSPVIVADRILHVLALTSSPACPD